MLTFIVMKKTIAILFVSLYLFSTTQLSELLKIPIFVEHYIEHRHENAKITLWDFLWLHYANGNIHDADYDRDMQLPFKALTYPVVACLSFIIPTPISFTNPLNNNRVEKQQAFYESPDYISLYLSSIWQPPRFC